MASVTMHGRGCGVIELYPCFSFSRLIPALLCALMSTYVSVMQDYNFIFYAWVICIMVMECRVKEDFDFLWDYMQFPTSLEMKTVSPTEVKLRISYYVAKIFKLSKLQSDSFAGDALYNVKCAAL
jgi:hypothetical protein